MLNKFQTLPLPVKIILILVLGAAAWTFAKNPQATLKNIQSAAGSLEKKTEKLITENGGKNQEPIIGEKIVLDEKIKNLSQELVKEVTKRIPQDLPAQVKKEVEEKVRVEVEKRVEEIVKQIVVERIKSLPDPTLEKIKEEICKVRE